MGGRRGSIKVCFGRSPGRDSVGWNYYRTPAETTAYLKRFVYASNVFSLQSLWKTSRLGDWTQHTCVGATFPVKKRNWTPSASKAKAVIGIGKIAGAGVDRGSSPPGSSRRAGAYSPVLRLTADEMSLPYSLSQKVHLLGHDSTAEGDILC